MIYKGADMTKKSLSKNAIPSQLIALIEKIGSNIQVARKRRRMTQKELATRVFCSIATINRLEKGDGGVSLNILCQVLWVLGIEDQLSDLASPERDSAGLQEDLQRIPKKIKRPTEHNKNMEF